MQALGSRSFLERTVHMSTLLGQSALRSFDTSRPAAENTTSAGTEVPEIARYLLARHAVCGNRDALAFHQARGLSSVAMGSSMK